jgi:hypothetical protein
VVPHISQTTGTKYSLDERALLMLLFLFALVLSSGVVEAADGDGVWARTLGSGSDDQGSAIAVYSQSNHVVSVSSVWGSMEGLTRISVSVECVVSACISISPCSPIY